MLVISSEVLSAYTLLVVQFRCDKSELKEVLELAGHVVLCNVMTISKKYARVMYSHPLEAVQVSHFSSGLKSKPK